MSHDPTEPLNPYAASVTTDQVSLPGSERSYSGIVRMGYSAWWCIGMIIPLVNILVGIRCIACPEGYADHGTLDTAGKVLVGIFLGAIVLGVLAVVIAAAG